MHEGLEVVDTIRPMSSKGPMEQYDQEPPPRIRPTIKAAPRIRQMYWCRLPLDAELPEFWKIRPVIVVSYRNTLHGVVTVIPTTTVPQPDNPWAVPISESMSGNKPSWAICDKPMTVATSRLKAFRDIPRLQEEEFRTILARLLEWLPSISGT